MEPWLTFESLLAEIPNAQATLADTVRALVYQSAPELFAQIDYDDDHAFLEPSLFAYYTAPDPAATLEQILFSYLPATAKPRRLRAYADDTGNIHISRIGRLRSFTRDAFCTLNWDADTGFFFDDPSGAPLAVREPDSITGSGLHVGQAIDPLLRRFVAPEWSKRGCGVYPPNYLAHVAALERAFLTLRRATPALFTALRAVTRRIFLYNADLPNSFATLSAHGVAFLNAKDNNDEVFFVDDLAHQCGHIIFNALTLEKDRFLARPANTPLRDFCRDQDDPRSLYSAFHGLFTFSMILWALRACVARDEFSGRHHHEALGRIAFNLGKFEIDLNNLAAPGLFTDDGRVLYDLFTDAYNAVFRDHHHAVQDFDLSGQPYVFDYSRFAARNPIERAPRTHTSQPAWSAQ